MADLEATDIAPGDLEDPIRLLETIHQRKTGRLLACSLELGAIVAGADDDTREQLTCFGQQIGLAFQVADDLLDVVGDAGRTGKAGGRDAELGKWTYPALVGVEESRELASRYIERACDALAPLGDAATPPGDVGRFRRPERPLMMELELLPRLDSPERLGEFTDDELLTLADEIREVLCSVVSDRTAHFASNLGVVELAIALHLVYDFRRDRLIWDTGHQVYPHKLLTGRFAQFHTMRQRGGLMGFPNPEESDYDLFMTGHAGASLSTMLGLKIGDDLQGEEDHRAVAVIGDGALPSGIVFEAFNNAAGLEEGRARHPQRQRDGHLPACRRAGLHARQGPHRAVLRRAETRRPGLPQQGPPRRPTGRKRPRRTSRMPSRASCTEACSSKNSASATSDPSTDTTCSHSAATSRWSRTSAGPCCCTSSPKRATASKPASEDPVQVPHARPVPAGTMTTR